MILKENLIKLVAKTTLNLTDEQITLLDNYVMMLDKWNKAYNLTSVRDPKEMLVKHIMDSIMVSPHLQGNTFIDVGTGPGLPGVPLAIINPNKQFDLVDSLGKRIRFLKQVQFELKLDNINPVQSRIEQYTNKHFDGVISRAFASLNDMLSWCQHLPKQNGAFYALKGNISQQEIDNIPNGFKVKETIELHIPNLDGQRHLVILQKI